MADKRVDDAMWNSGVHCNCEAYIYVYIAYIAKNHIGYNYLCKKCNMKGSWPTLAQAKFGKRQNSRPSFK